MYFSQAWVIWMLRHWVRILALQMFAIWIIHFVFVDLGTMARVTCGQAYLYHNFNLQRDGPRVQHDVSRVLSRNTAFEAVVRVRASKVGYVAARV
jgi:protein transport protein SEC24